MSLKEKAVAITLAVVTLHLICCSQHLPLSRRHTV
jgi:hypothetical protein